MDTGTSSLFVCRKQEWQEPDEHRRQLDGQANVPVVGRPRAGQVSSEGRGPTAREKVSVRALGLQTLQSVPVSLHWWTVLNLGPPPSSTDEPAWRGSDGLAPEAEVRRSHGCAASADLLADTPGSNHWLHVCQEAEHVLFAGVDGSRPSMALDVVVAAFSDCCGILIIIEASGKKQPWCGAGAVAAPLGLAEWFLLQRPLQPLPGWSRAAQRTSRITGARGTAHRTRPPGELKVRDHQEAVLAGLALCPILFQQNTCPLLHVVQL